MKVVEVVGLGLGPADVTPRLRAVIDKARVLAGGARLLDWFPDHPARRLVLGGGLDAWLDQVASVVEEGVVVLASGDPGFFGIGARLVKRLGPKRVVIHPNLTAMQAAFARLKLPWQAAALVSLHGRPEGAWLDLWAALYRHDLVGVYTDPVRGPALLARALLARGQEFWRLAVLEDLGGENERVGWFSLEEAARGEFSPLNLVVLERVARPEPLRLGLAEEAYQHQGDMITKTEVRAAALAKLALGPGQTVWDLGAGCGSVGLEATLLTPGGRVVAVEQKPERVRQIEANRARYGAASLEVVAGRMPGCLADLPDPDRVFVGGGGYCLGPILEEAARRLPAGGVVVAGLVKLESLEVARRTMLGQGLAVEETLLQLSRGAPLAGGVRMKGLNPVWLICGQKPAGGQT